MKLKLAVALLASSLWCGWAQAQDNWAYNFVTTGTRSPGISFANSSLTAFAISWDVSPPVLSCALQVDSSADGVSWGSGDLIATQNCAAVGSVAATSLAAGKNFVRINVTGLNGNGGVNVRLRGYAGAGGSSSSSSANTIVASNAAYGVTAAGNEDCSATFSNGSGVITLSANTVLPPASAINSWRVFGTAGCQDFGPATFSEVLPVGTITAINVGSRQITSSTNANGNATGTATQHVTFAPIEDAQLTLAETAAWSYGGTDCYTLVLPAGIIGVKKGHFNTMTCNSQSTGPQSTGAHLLGQGRVATRLMMFPDFDWTSCPTFNSFATCFGAINGLTKERLGWSGGQHPGTNPVAETCVVNDGTDDFSFNIGLFGLGNTLPALHGYCMTSVGTNDQVVVEDAMGSVGGKVQLGGGGNGSCSQCYFGDNNSVSLSASVAGKAKFATFGDGFGPTNATTGSVAITGAGLWKSVGDVWLLTSASNYVLCNSGAVCSIDGMNIFGTISGNMSAFATSIGPSHIIVRDSNISAGNTGFIWNLAAATALGDDMGGNVYTFTGAGGYASFTAGAALRTLVPTSTYTTAPTAGLTDCASSAGTCTQHISGSVSIAAAATTVTVATTALQTNSTIYITRDDTLGTKLGVTCNTATAAGDIKVSTRTPGTSFIITVQNAPAATPLCLNWEIR